MDTRNFNEILGRNIRRLRMDLGITQMDLAEKLGYGSTGMVSQVENGLKGIDRKRLYEAAKLFRVPMEVLLDEREYSMEEIMMFRALKELIISKEKPKHYEAIKSLLIS